MKQGAIACWEVPQRCGAAIVSSPGTATCRGSVGDLDARRIAGRLRAAARGVGSSFLVHGSSLLFHPCGTLVGGLGR